MKSAVEKLCRLSNETGKNAEYRFNNNTYFSNIEVATYHGSLSDYYSGYKEGYTRSVELWVHTKQMLEDLNIPTFNMIVDNDIIGDDERKEWFDKTGIYDYHCEYFPVAWLEDIWPDFDKYTEKPEKENDTEVEKKQEEKQEKSEKEESLMEFALKNGCDYMDMNTMNIYKHF